MSNPPLVSIVIPSFNQGRFIEETILSVLNQDYPAIELIIIDGGSRDQSVETIKKYEGKIAYWVSEPDQGQADAINKGWRFASGDFLGWLNSDDLLLPNATPSSVEFLTNNRDYGFVYGDVFRIDEDGHPLSCTKNGDFDVVQMILDSGWISQPGNLFRRSLYKAIGELDTSLHFQLDLDYWFRAGLYGKVGHLKMPLAKFRIHNRSKTSSQSYLAADDILRIYEKIYSWNNLPEELVLHKNLAWANAYSYSAAAMCAAEKFPSSYSRFFRALRIYPGILLETKHLRRFMRLLALSMIGGKNTFVGRIIKRFLSASRKSL